MPRLQSGEAIIRVAYTGICGTDLDFYSGKRRLPSARETVLGHEIAGVVEEASGGAAGSPNRGQRAVISMITGCGTCGFCIRDEALHCPEGKRVGINRDGGFAEYVSVPLRNVFAVPADLPLQVATLADPVACVLNGLARLEGRHLDEVLVLGGGTIGTIAVMLLLDDPGRRRVSLVDRHPWRREHAEALGACACSSLAEMGRFSAVIDASGSAELLTASLDHLEPRATVLMLGLHHAPVALPLHRMIQKEVRMEFSLCYGFRAFEAAIAYLGRKRELASELITAIYAEKEAEIAFATTLSNKRGKTVISFQPG